MPIPARKSVLMALLSSFCIAVVLLIISPSILSSTAKAQYSAGLNQPTPRPAAQPFTDIAPYAQPELDAGVPHNQHTFIQSILIEVVASTYCLVTGIDPINPSQGCLDINPVTHKLTLSAPADEKTGLRGIIGIVPGMFSAIYHQPASSTEYVRYLASNFGIIQPAQAQVHTFTGAQALLPIQALWVAVRNITYLLFVVIFILIGLGIMLRIKIDPRTVMTIQNQIPRIIMGILLITFSYAISGLMIDAMWISTYAGINVITGAGGNLTDPVIQGAANANCQNLSLSTRAKDNLHTSSVFDYAQLLLSQTCDEPVVLGRPLGVNPTGLPAVALSVGASIGRTVTDLLNFAFYGKMDPINQCNWGKFTETVTHGINDVVLAPLWLVGLKGPAMEYLYGKPDPAKVEGGDTCIAYVLSDITGFFIKIMSILIVVCIILWMLIRIWMELLKSYVMIILYSITGPLWIIMGLLPGRPLGFGAWFRRLFAHLAVFPATAFLLVTASILLNAFGLPPGDNANKFFSPPLVGNPNSGNIGYLISFGILLITPGLLNILKTSLKTVGKEGLMATGSITNMIAAGTSTPKGFGRGLGSRVFQPYDPLRGRQMGIAHQILGGKNPTSLRYRVYHGLVGNSGGFLEGATGIKRVPADDASGNKTETPKKSA